MADLRRTLSVVESGLEADARERSEGIDRLFDRISEAKKLNEKIASEQKKARDKITLNQLDDINNNRPFTQDDSGRIVQNPVHKTPEQMLQESLIRSSMIPVPRGLELSSRQISPAGALTQTFSRPKTEQAERAETPASRSQRRKRLVDQLLNPEPAVVEAAKRDLKREFGIDFDSFTQEQKSGFLEGLKQQGQKFLDMFGNFFSRSQVDTSNISSITEG